MLSFNRMATYDRIQVPMPTRVGSLMVGLEAISPRCCIWGFRDLWVPWDRGEDQGFRVKQTVSLPGPVATGCPPLGEGTLRLFPHLEGGCDNAFQSFGRGKRPCVCGPWPVLATLLALWVRRLPWLDIRSWTEPPAVGGVGSPSSSPLPLTSQRERSPLPIHIPAEVPHCLQEGC